MPTKVAGKIVNKNTNISTTAAAIPTTAATGRISMAIKNNGSATIYIGDASVTSSNGYPLAAGAEISLDVGEQVVVYGIAASGTQDIRTLEGV